MALCWDISSETMFIVAATQLRGTPATQCWVDVKSPTQRYNTTHSSFSSLPLLHVSMSLVIIIEGTYQNK